VDAVGVFVGEFVGEFVVGLFVGLFVGTSVGIFVGTSVGKFDGELVVKAQNKHDSLNDNGIPSCVTKHLLSTASHFFNFTIIIHTKTIIFLTHKEYPIENIVSCH